MRVVECSVEMGEPEPDILFETRAGIPVGEQRRFDVYRDVSQ